MPCKWLFSLEWNESQLKKATRIPQERDIRVLALMIILH